MPLTYPLVIPGSLPNPPGEVFPGTTIPIPTTPGPAKANLKKMDAIGEFIGPFDGSSQQQQFQDQHWELDLDWPEMTWAQFAALDAFAGALHGKLGSFLWGPPLATGPQGSGITAGSPVATGADAPGSNLLHTAAWLPSQSGILLPGDFFAIAPNSLAIAILEVAAGGAVSIEGVGLAPAWLVPGASIYLAGTGLTDGGPFVVAGFDNLNPGWIVDFTNPEANAGNGITGTLGAIAGATSVLWRLYQYINPGPLMSDGGGNATLDIFPTLREAPPAGSPIVLVNPLGTFRLSTNRRESPATKTKTFTFSMKCREAI